MGQTYGPVYLNEYNGTANELMAKYGKQIKPVKEVGKVDVKDANAIIDKYLKPAWGVAKTPAEKQEIGRLADTLREASGQAKQNG
ncbi:hypothetical protein [Paenibacillus macquariensis]|uniref:Uncharacterized protein n=1 Tax=Paenibacillus macquariensis TaxID=948756 RepID=A0ABY1KDM0_9BACL|nr:hypothetical protein [Paenibacillus macquariensis]OAB27365.1 hypothetical protein PMSM_25470 [Paenibacillus macquariensis subsp. macquariensis]SIR66248.1 hypothetical protein SAMN05421578_12916 [Paenibacillus macquariensis]